MSLASAAPTSVAACSVCPRPGPATMASRSCAEHVVGVAQHQLRRDGVDIERLLEQTDVNAAGAQLERGAAGEQRGAGHAGRAAEDAERAGRALVEIARPRLQHIGEQRRGSAAQALALEACDIAASRSATLTSPQWSGPSSVSRPGLSAMKVIVCVARTARRAPGRYRTGCRSARRARAPGSAAGWRTRPASRSRRSMGRARPMPNRPSITRPQLVLGISRGCSRP